MAQKRSDEDLQRALMRRIELAMAQADNGRGITKVELAKRTQQSNQGVYDWFNKGNMPGGDALIRLPDALGVSAHWLITGEGPMTPERGGGMERAFGMGGIAAIDEMQHALSKVRERWSHDASSSARGGAASVVALPTEERVERGKSAAQSAKNVISIQEKRRSRRPGK